MLSTVLLCIALASGAPGLKDAPRKDGSIIGEWLAEQITLNGKPSEKAKGDRLMWVFGGDGTLTVSNDGKTLMSFEFTADGKSTPATLDMKGVTGLTAGSNNQCIYKIEGDKLTLNARWSTFDRPTKFESTVDSKCNLYVFKRVKEK
jgi:uncharacterized protein (TIGR03067 family)